MKCIRNIVVVLSAFFCVCTATAGNERVELRGSYDHVIQEYQSQKQAYNEAVHHAKTNAMIEKFGSVLSQDNTVILSNTDSQSRESFVSLSNELVRGEWISDIEEPHYTIMTNGKAQVLRVTVHGYAREIKSAKVDINAKPLRLGTDLRYTGYEFNDRDNLYLYFRSPSDGYVTVFMADENLMSQGDESVFCLLPYQNSGEGAVTVKHDTDYVFFSDEKNTGNSDIVDNLVMTATRPVEYNTLFVIFSPNSFSKPNATKEQQDLGQLVLPRSLKYSDFKTWLGRYRDLDRDMQVLSIPLIVRNNK